MSALLITLILKYVLLLFPIVYYRMEQQNPESSIVKSVTKCPECQEDVSPADKFCKECGNKCK